MGERKTVLVVEDEQFLSDIYKHQLEEKGCKVLVARDGERAFEMLEQTNPDVILLDLIMPTMNGFDFLEALRLSLKHKNCRVVVLSNLGQDTDKARCKSFGVDDYFVKITVSMENIISVVLK